MAEFETLRYGVHDGVATIELARPEKRNALNAQGFTELGDAAERAAGDAGIRVVVIRGEGPSFCAGIDVALLGQLAGTRGGGGGARGGGPPPPPSSTMTSARRRTVSIQRPSARLPRSPADCVNGMPSFGCGADEARVA
jgi:enoyl-CoA hydratase/carnithine racemase